MGRVGPDDRDLSTMQTGSAIPKLVQDKAGCRSLFPYVRSDRISSINASTCSGFVAQLVQNLTALCLSSIFSHKENEYDLPSSLITSCGKMGNC